MAKWLQWNGFRVSEWSDRSEELIGNSLSHWELSMTSTVVLVPRINKYRSPWQPSCASDVIPRLGGIPRLGAPLTVRVVLTWPSELNPIISCDILDVLPDWISCTCLNRFKRALPLPLSSSPWASTPTSVDFPQSTLPSTAILRSRNCKYEGVKVS